MPCWIPCPGKVPLQEAGFLTPASVHCPRSAHRLRRVAEVAKPARGEATGPAGRALRLLLGALSSASQPQRKGSPRCLTCSQRRCLDHSGLDLLCFPGSVLGTVGGVAYGEAGKGSTRDLLGPELTPSSGWCTRERGRWRMKCDFENLESSKT